MNEVLLCEWCEHTQAHHSNAGCEVALCRCMLTRSDLVAYSLTVALEEIRNHWYA